MRNTTLRRSMALVASAMLLASLAAATVAAPAAAGTPTCFGKAATIVGTAKGEVIIGTAGADVIVARGGHDKVYGLGGNDTICGNSGNDRIWGGLGSDLLMGQVGDDQLFGNAAPDRLLGGPGNDGLNGGVDIDLCVQGSGIGLRVNCERPLQPPPPGPPAPIDLKDVLAIAYTDLNKNHLPDAGDVMIAQLVDTDGNGLDAGDKVVMGMYPTALKPVWPADFESWGVKSHTVTGVAIASPNDARVYIGTPSPALVNGLYSPDSVWFSKIGTLVGSAANGPAADVYEESADVWMSRIYDRHDTLRDYIATHPLSLSSPASKVEAAAKGTGDDYLIDVELYLPTT